jgi:hypothetical protein
MAIITRVALVFGEEIASIIYRYVVQRLPFLEEPLSPAEEAMCTSFYINYVKYPSSLRMPHRVRLNDPLGESTFAQPKLDKQLKKMHVTSRKTD